MLPLIRPKWPVPSNVQSYSTTRLGGASEAPFASLNLSDHVGDDAKTVAANRALLPHNDKLMWMQQTHSNNVVEINAYQSEPVKADGLVTSQSNLALAVMTADCLPLLLCDSAGTRVAAIHCGWRGLVSGIIGNAVATLATTPTQLLAWLGPCISGVCYEVGAEVYASFGNTEKVAFSQGLIADKYLLDLQQLAALQLQQLGVTRIYTEQACTFRQPERFFSYRRDGVTGRMASVIMLS